MYTININRRARDSESSPDNRPQLHSVELGTCSIYAKGRFKFTAKKNNGNSGLCGATSAAIRLCMYYAQTGGSCDFPS